MQITDDPLPVEIVGSICWLDDAAQLILSYLLRLVADIARNPIGLFLFSYHFPSGSFF